MTRTHNFWVRVFIAPKRNKGTKLIYKEYSIFINASMVILILFCPCIIIASPVDINSLPYSDQRNSLNYMVYGHGRLSCDDYVQARRLAGTGQYLQLNYFRQWMAGYMTGYNRYLLKGVGAVADEGAEHTIEQGLEDYCTEHPEDAFALAATAVIRGL